jgi:hypothetical protein
LDLVEYFKSSTHPRDAHGPGPPEPRPVPHLRRLRIVFRRYPPGPHHGMSRRVQDRRPNRGYIRGRAVGVVGEDAAQCRILQDHRIDPVIERTHLAPHAVALLVEIPASPLRVLLHHHALYALRAVSQTQVHVAVVGVLRRSPRPRVSLLGVLVFEAVLARLLRRPGPAAAGAPGRGPVAIPAAVGVLGAAGP